MHFLLLFRDILSIMQHPPKIQVAIFGLEQDGRAALHIMARLGLIYTLRHRVLILVANIEVPMLACLYGAY